MGPLEVLIVLFLLTLVGVPCYLLYRAFRPHSRQCPGCGYRVKRGFTICQRCGYDFLDPTPDTDGAQASRA